MSSKTKTNWIGVDKALPDDGMIVLIHAPKANEPIWLGYYSDEMHAWCEPGGGVFPEVNPITHWADLPDPPRA
jgi:Protein of unknown function (DUF551)